MNEDKLEGAQASMGLDDPGKPEFSSWRSYLEFAQRVRHIRRYVWENEVQAFLDTVLATLKERDIKISKNATLWRAQRGVDCIMDKDEDGNEIGDKPQSFDPERMKPVQDRAKEGRVNPAGIPVLYLASSERVAISEVRPWIGSEVSVSRFKILRALKAVNLSLGHDQFSCDHLILEQICGVEPVDATAKEKAVWIDLDCAFSQPVTLSDDAADYVPTQILAELFKSAGYDAIVYRSQFGEKGYNIVLFNVEDATAITGAPYKVTGIDLKYEGPGDEWFLGKRSELKERKSD